MILFQACHVHCLVILDPLLDDWSASVFITRALLRLERTMNSFCH